MRLIRINYRDWKILILPQNTFTCCPPDGEPIANDSPYESAGVALAAAKTFVDRMILRDAMQAMLDEWLETGRIKAVEYDRFDQIIGAIVRADISDHLESARTLLPQPPETHRDPSP